jgi:hemolysin III
MFGVSALVHMQVWPAEKWHRLFQLDHTAIFCCFAGTTTPIALLALDGAARWFLLGGMWFGALAGIVAEWLPFHPPRGLMNTIFLVLGWFPILVIVPLWDGLGASGFALLLAGGACYTVGAVIVGAQKPDPWPATFGYHEIWHLLVVIAVALHWSMVAFVLL